MDSTDTLAAREADLQARIDAARQRLAENSKMEWAEIGDMLEGFSLELEEAHKSDAASRHGIYDRIEGELKTIHSRLDTARPTD